MEKRKMYKKKIDKLSKEYQKLESQNEKLQHDLTMQKLNNHKMIEKHYEFHSSPITVKNEIAARQ